MEASFFPKSETSVKASLRIYVVAINFYIGHSTLSVTGSVLQRPHDFPRSFHTNCTSSTASFQIFRNLILIIGYSLKCQTVQTEVLDLLIATAFSNDLVIKNMTKGETKPAFGFTPSIAKTFVKGVIVRIHAAYTSNLNFFFIREPDGQDVLEKEGI